MKTLNVSEARNMLPALIESVSTTHNPVTPLRYGKPAAKKITSLAALAAASMLPVAAAAQGAPAGKGGAAPASPRWELAWHDEFDRSTLNLKNWTRCERGRSDWNNTMSDDPRLLKIQNGALLLTGVQNTDLEKDPAPYLTAGVTSKDKFQFQYGKAEIRARFKSAQGAWPAIWMLGLERGWPANGEIDLMEHLNFDDKVYQTVHSEYTVKIDKSNTPPKSGAAAIQRDEWNVYGCEWDEEKIVLAVNGKPTFTYPRVPEKGEAQWPFNQPFYFILSMQIGGSWVNGAGPTNPAHYPAVMAIDWVRVYRRQ